MVTHISEEGGDAGILHQIVEVASSITCDISGFIACGGVASLLITEGESKAELDDSSLPPLVFEGNI